MSGGAAGSGQRAAGSGHSALESSLRAAFDRFAAALAAQDVAAYRALAVADAPAQEQLFRRNAEKLATNRWRLRLRSLSIEGEVGEARFELIDTSGERVDEGTATFTLEGDDWKLRAL